jgi:excisionase family DNA binding protein
MAAQQSEGRKLITGYSGGNPAKILLLKRLSESKRGQSMKHEATNKSDIKMHRIDDASAISSLSRSTLYDHIRHGRLKSIKVGGRRLIPDSALRELLQIEELA